MVIFPEDPMEIAGIIISRKSNDIFYGKRGRGKQKSRLVQALHLQELLKGMPGMFFNNFADGIGRDVKLPGYFVQSCRQIIMVNIL